MEHARRAAGADLPALVALLRAQRTEVGPQRGGDLWVAEHHEPSVEHLDAQRRRDDSLVLCGTYDDVIVGALTARLADVPGVGAIARIDDLYVEPDAREVGVGAALINELRSWALERGCAGIDAVVLPGARATKNFFEAHGLVARAITVHQRFERPPTETP